MGMLPAVARRWRRHAGAGARQHRARPGASPALLAAAAKTLRIGLQIAIVCAGAMLVIEHEASGGTIVAAAVLSARLLLPFEQLIDGWRQWLDAFAALERLRDVLVARRRHPLARAGGGRAARRSSPTGSASCRRARSAPLAAQRLVPRRGRRAPRRRSAPRAPASRRWRGSSSASGRRPPAASSSTARAPSPTSAAASARRSATCRRTRCCFDGKVRENIARFRDADMADVVAAARARRRARADRPPAAGLRDRGSPTPARGSPAASGSGWRWPGRSSATRS